MIKSEMPIFTRTFDFLVWLLPVAERFPKSQRFSVTQRLLSAALDLREQLEIANRRQGQDRLTHLRAADEALDRVRLYIRLAVKWGWLTGGQYQHVAQMVTEIGRLLGGWVKVTQSS